MSRKSRKSSKKRLLNWIILSAFIVLLLYLYIGGKYGLYRHWQLKQKRQALMEEIHVLKQERDSLRIVIQRLKTDSSYIAKVAREKYNMGKPDEEIIRIITKKE